MSEGSFSPEQQRPPVKDRITAVTSTLKDEIIGAAVYPTVIGAIDVLAVDKTLPWWMYVGGAALGGALVARDRKGNNEMGAIDAVRESWRTGISQRGNADNQSPEKDFDNQSNYSGYDQADSDEEKNEIP